MRTKEKAPPRTGPSVSLQLKFWSAEGAAFLPARTAVEFRRPTKALEDVIAGGGAGLRYFTVPGFADRCPVAWRATESLGALGRNAVELLSPNKTLDISKTDTIADCGGACCTVWRNK
jgi:hypothetical protein